MAKLFKTEKQKMAELDKAEILLKSKKQSVSPTELDEDKDEAENQAENVQRFNTTARKQSLLPIGNLFITLLHIRSTMTNTFVFCILEFDEDEDDEEENLSSEDDDVDDDDDDDDEDYEDK